MIIVLLGLFAFTGFAQQGNENNIRIDFNDGQVREVKDRITIKAPGTNLVEDRFHNKASAIQIHGVKSSYLNLGTSALLKTREISISLWVKVVVKNYVGKGYESNPIIMVRNSEEEDFCLAYAILYDYKIQKFRAGGSIDSLKAVNIYAKEAAILEKWHHLVLTLDDHSGSLYLDGELQASQAKDFQARYNMQDSVLVGHTGSEKNQRYLAGCVDDIVIYNRVLNQQEVLALYREKDPNTFKNGLYLVLKITGIAALIGLVILIMAYRNRQNLRKQKEQFDLINKITELELKVVKAQINPHFISNSLAAIQELVYRNDIEKAGQYIAKFSFFLRQVLNHSDKNYISVAKEIEVIRLNVELEQLRFKNEFRFELEVDKALEVDATLIPSLITQPFIENAVWHGLLPLSGIREPVLKIRIFLHNGSLVVEIEDNGIGRNPLKTRGEASKGTQLVLDKIESLNRLSGQNGNSIEIVDLLDTQQQPAGTLIRIQIYFITE